MPQIAAGCPIFAAKSTKFRSLAEQRPHQALELSLAEKPQMGRDEASLPIQNDSEGQTAGAIPELARHIDDLDLGDEDGVTDPHLASSLAAFLC